MARFERIWTFENTLNSTDGDYPLISAVSPTYSNSSGRDGYYLNPNAVVTRAMPEFATGLEAFVEFWFYYDTSYGYYYALSMLGDPMRVDKENPGSVAYFNAYLANTTTIPANSWAHAFFAKRYDGDEFSGCNGVVYHQDSIVTLGYGNPALTVCNTDGGFYYNSEYMGYHGNDVGIGAGQTGGRYPSFKIDSIRI